MERDVGGKLNQVTNIVCIGTSTGGPRALQTVLMNFPASIKAPIVIVQHMPPMFTKSLANRLDTICNIQVKEAEQGDVLQNGVAYIAPGGKHMRVLPTKKGLTIEINEDALVNGHRPSVDVLFESIATIQPYKKIAVIMTGMGSDGAKGLQILKDTGCTTIAEAEQSCIVYGMPRAAVMTGKVDDVVPVSDISKTIMKYIT